MSKLKSSIVLLTVILLSFPRLLIGQNLDLKYIEGDGVTINSNGIANVSLKCPTGYKVISGGWQRSGGSTSLIVLGSSPQDSTLDQWSFSFMNGSTSVTRVYPYIICVRTTTLNISERESGVPVNIKLAQNYPNPFNPSTSFDYTINTASNVKLEIFNLEGQLIITLFNGLMEAGDYHTTWNGKSAYGSSVSSGTYFYRLVSDGVEQTKKMILIR
ncbi:MAG: T9SS type A sorting domain-containing protein [Ignavibacteriaceae bacterium]|jgi:hypothetical protein